MAVKYIPDDIISRISVLMNGDTESIQSFIKNSLEEKLRGEKLIAAEADYILTFMDKSTDHCTSEDDFEFDAGLKEKLVGLAKADGGT